MAEKAFRNSKAITEKVVKKFGGLPVTDSESADRLIAASSLVFVPRENILDVPRFTVEILSDLETHYLLSDLDIGGRKDPEMYGLLFDNSHIAPFLRIFALSMTDQLRDRDYHELMRCPLPRDKCIEGLASAVKDIYRGIAHDSGLRDEYHALNLFLAMHQDPKMLASVEKVLRQNDGEITSLYNALNSEFMLLIGKARKKGIDIPIEVVGDPHHSAFYGRKLKSIGSLVLKMKKYGLGSGQVNEVHDLMAFTVVVPELEHVYRFLEMVTKHFGKRAMVEIEDFNEKNMGNDRYKSLHLRLSPEPTMRKFSIGRDFMEQFELHIRTREQQFMYFNGGWAHGMMKSDGLRDIPEASGIRSAGVNLFPWRASSPKGESVETRILVRANVIITKTDSASSANFFVPKESLMADVVALAGVSYGHGLGSDFTIERGSAEIRLSDPVDFHQVSRVCDGVTVVFNGGQSHLASSTIRSLLKKVQTDEARNQLQQIWSGFNGNHRPKR